IFYGKGGEISTNQRDEQELAVLSLHLLQSSLVYINTLMLQRVLTEPAWMAGMTTDDLRGLTPLIYTHVNPYGTFSLDLDAVILDRSARPLVARIEFGLHADLLGDVDDH